jgi:enoyl-CoA hydratase/carnithine racemase
VFYSLRMILTFEHGAVRELRLNRPPVNALAPVLITALLHSVQMAPREGKRAGAVGLTGDVLGRTRRARSAQARSAGQWTRFGVTFMG